MKPLGKPAYEDGLGTIKLNSVVECGFISIINNSIFISKAQE